MLIVLLGCVVCTKLQPLSSSFGVLQQKLVLFLLCVACLVLAATAQFGHFGGRKKSLDTFGNYEEENRY